MTAKKPASAEPKTDAKSPAPRRVEGVQLIRMPMAPNKPSHPVAVFRGEAPAKGETLEFTLENGVTYRGEVAEAVAASGEVMAEFTGPLTVAPKE